MQCESIPLVSVIIPNYNHAEFLAERIDSVLVQTFQDFELILLDDCSIDGSLSVLREYASHPKVSHLVTNELNSGSPFFQWKRGIELARGKYIWIAESDDVAEPEFLEVLVRVLDARDNVVLAYCRSEVIDDRGSRHGDVPWCLSIGNFDIATSYEATGTEEIRRKLAFYNSIPNASAVLLRGDVLRRLSLPVGMICCGDWITWIRMLRLGDIAYQSRQLNLYRSHVGASTRAPQAYERSVKTVMEFGFAAREADLPLFFQVLGIKRYSMLRRTWCDAVSAYPEVRADVWKLPFVLSMMVYLESRWRSVWQWLRMNRISRKVRDRVRKLFPANA